MPRLYQMRRSVATRKTPAQTVPGFRLCEVIDQFYAEGVVPDFLPADLGEDSADELDEFGRYKVDEDGRIDRSVIDRLESQYENGIKAIDEASIPDE